jgi:hypothetical protein
VLIGEGEPEHCRHLFVPNTYRTSLNDPLGISPGRCPGDMAFCQSFRDRMSIRWWDPRKIPEHRVAGTVRHLEDRLPPPPTVSPQRLLRRRSRLAMRLSGEVLAATRRVEAGQCPVRRRQ